MCKKNDTIYVKVKIASDLSHTGKEYWKNIKIDRCISGLVSALQEGGINMRSSCCGHGKGPGEIALQDGRLLIVHSAKLEKSDVDF